MKKNLALLLALVSILTGGVAVAWWLQPRGPIAPLPVRPPDDDLQLLVSLYDAGEAREHPHDRLAAVVTIRPRSGEAGDVPSGELVLARARDGAVLALPADGGAPRTIANLDGPAWGLAIAGGSVFLSTTRATGPGARGAVVRVALAGGPTRVVTESLAHPRALASDGRSVFAVDVDASEAGLLRRSTIVRIPADGGPLDGTSPATPGGSADVLPARRPLPERGRDLMILARSDGEIDRVAFDADNLYWADPLDGAIRAIPKAGGEPRTLAAERGLPEQLVLSGDALVWVERRSETLFSMPASGGSPRAVAQDFAGFANLVVDRRGAWWTPTSAADGRYRVLFAPLAGGDSQLAGDSAEPVDALASDGVHLYWARNGEVSRADAAPSGAQRGQ